MRILRCLVMLALVSGPAVALGDDVAQQARRLFVSGRQHFDLGEYEQALKDFKEGYRIKDDPVFLYNIAQCQKLMNQNSEALRSYQVYISRAPDASNRDEVERKIAALKEAIASQKEATAKPPNHVLPPETAATPTSSMTHPLPPASAAIPVATAAPAQAERKPVYKKGWFWATLGGVVVVGAGVGLAIALTRGGSTGNTYPAVQF